MGKIKPKQTIIQFLLMSFTLKKHVQLQKMAIIQHCLTLLDFKTVFVLQKHKGTKTVHNMWFLPKILTHFFFASIY